MSDVDQKYADWIAANVSQPYGQCERYSRAMCEAFPELRLARGYYYCLSWGQRGHWWCVAPDGTIVDATESQFPSAKFRCGGYEEVTEDDPQPWGTCYWCGETTHAPPHGYDDPMFCSREHHDAAVIELNGAR